MKKALPVILLCLLPLSAAAYLFYCLETYYSVVHNDSGFIVCTYSILVFLITLILWLKNRASNKYLTVLFAVSTLILCGVFYVGNRIPFCVECDHVTAADLGFLTHWITPIDAQ